MSRDYFAACTDVQVPSWSSDYVPLVEGERVTAFGGLVVWSAETLADVVARIAGES